MIALCRPKKEVLSICLRKKRLPDCTESCHAGEEGMKKGGHRHVRLRLILHSFAPHFLQKSKRRGEVAVTGKSVPRDVVFLQLVLHEAAGNAEQFGRMRLNEVGAYEGALDERGFNLVQRVG